MNTLITEFVVTEQCNLNCEYCYMKDCGTYMNMDGVANYRRHVQKMMDVYQCNKFHISYFGGEPLLNWDLVRDAIPEFKSDPRLESQVIITNGLLLTDYMVEHIKKHNIYVSWSFDGMWQDSQRPHKDIPNTLEIYKARKDLIREVSGGCKVMVAPESVPTLTENFKFLVEEFGVRTPDFSLVRDDIWSKEDVELFRVECDRLTKQTIEYYNDGVSAMPGFYTLAVLDMLQGKIKGKRPFGCFAGCHGVGYFPNGQWYPCARFGTDKEYLLMDEVGHLFTQTINDLNKPELTNPQTFAKCKACELYTFCNAGCTYSQFKLKKGKLIAEPVNSVCELFKIIYKNTTYINDVLKYNNVYQNYLTEISKRIGVGSCKQ